MPSFGRFDGGKLGDQAIAQDKRIKSGFWIPALVITRLRIVGSGSLVLDARDSDGNVASNIFSASYSNTTEAIEYVYPGDSGVEIRATFPSTLTVEVI